MTTRHQITGHRPTGAQTQVMHPRVQAHEKDPHTPGTFKC